MKYPNNVKQLQSFIGICNYYRKFVKDFAEIVQPLNKLIKKDTKWIFDEDCKEAFDTFKR